MRATKVNAGLAESNGKLLLGIWRDSLHVTCRLTACTPGSAPGPTLGNEYGKTLPFYPGRPVPEETFTNSHPSSSSDILYHLPPFTTIHGILFVQFTSLTVLLDNLSPGPLWSSSWPWTLNFILHAFLHPIIIIWGCQLTPV